MGTQVAQAIHDVTTCAPYLLPMQHDLRLWQAIAAGEAAVMLLLLAVGFFVRRKVREV